MKYQCIFTKNAEKEFSKIDSYQQKKIDTWILHNLKNCIVPRQYGKSLSGQLQRYWSYRVGNYRIICEIDDENKRIYIMTIGHRSDIYDKMIREEDILYETEKIEDEY